MPTGYTHAVQSGEITTFKEFALRCARNFGALILMRDDPPGTPIPEEFTPSDHHEKAIADAEADLRRFEIMTPQEADAAAQAEYERAVADRERWEEERRVQHKRYQAMLLQVEAWEPPSPDHENMKEFMRKQLVDSIEWDCGESHLSPPARMSGKEWQQAKLNNAMNTIDYRRKSHAEEVERTNGRNRWVKQLRESLAGEAVSV